ncbi:MAG: HD domain-containing protein [Sedimentisphaeraceae bacterium JB056]
MRKNLINDMKRLFGKDRRRIDHALSVLEYAEQIADVEGGDREVIVASAILHDIGIQEAEKKHGSSAGNYQELEGPPIAREILSKYDLSEEKVDHVCDIIANHHSDKGINSTEFKIVWDADWMVNIPVEFPDMQGEKLQKLINKVFKTATGSKIAKEEFFRCDVLKRF